ncbi:MAG: cation transporter [bacterium]|nr:cation transporter [Deltaproteobacteria bacterium]MCP4906618.1 cation transporter [bacterium]
MGHAHSHGGQSTDAHGHHHGDARTMNRRRLFLVLCLALSYAGVEFIGGLITGSLALLADSLHMVSDVAALALSLLAVWMASRPASRRRTFGNSRAEILAALANGLALAVVAVFITIHAFERFLTPYDVEGQGVMIVASGGLVINLISLWILEAGRSESLNIRGAWLHIASDTLASVGVVLSGVGIWAFDWIWLDPTVSLVVSALVLLSAWHLIREALDVLMETAPSHLDPEEIRSVLLEVPGVVTLHCLHVWTIGNGEVSLSSHLVVDQATDPEELLQEVREELAARFSIEHTTIQIEIADPDPSAEPSCAEACDPGALLA